MMHVISTLRKRRNIAIILVVVLVVVAVGRTFYPRSSDISIDRQVALGQLSYFGRPEVALEPNGKPFLVWRSLSDSYRRIVVASIDRTWGLLQNRQPLDVYAIDPTFGGVGYAYPHVAVSGSTVYAAWSECCRRPVSYAFIVVQASSDGGVSFSKNVYAPTGSGGQEDIAVDDSGNLYIVWIEVASWTPRLIAFSTLPVAGTSFTNAVHVGFPGSQPTIAVDASTVFLAWSADNGSLVFSRSVDRGRNFDLVLQIDGARSVSKATPQLAAKDGRVFLVWQSQEPDGVHLRFAASNDAGLTFSEAVDLEEVPGLSPVLDPSLSVGLDGNVYVAWASYKNYLESGLVVRAKRAPLTVGSWTEFITGAGKVGKDHHSMPSIAVDGSGNYFIVYELLDSRDQPSAQQVRLLTNLSLPTGFQLLADYGLALGLGGGAAVASVILFLLLRRMTKRDVLKTDTRSSPAEKELPTGTS